MERRRHGRPSLRRRKRPGRLGDFEIVREVGRGGMGVVYEALQISLGRRVALKCCLSPPCSIRKGCNAFRMRRGPPPVCITAISCRLRRWSGSRRPLLRHAVYRGRNLADLIHDMRLRAGLPDEEAEATATAKNGRPVASIAKREAGGTLCDSTSPAAALSTQRASAPQTFFRTTAELAVQAAQALHHAHQEGVVHRDVKPANLMVDAAGRLWVTDFGLAQVHNDPRLTTTGALVGTLRYMSPEQASGDQVVDHRTDLYSLGATLYELLALQPVFDGRDRGTLLRQITQEEPAAAAPAESVYSGRPGNHRRQGDGEKPRRPLSHGTGAGGRPAAVLGGQANSRQAAIAAGKGREMGAAPSAVSWRRPSACCC